MPTRREFGIATALLGIGCRKRNSVRPFTLSTTVDFPDDAGFGPYSPELLDNAMATLKNLGVTRVQWMFYPDSGARLSGASIWDWGSVPYGRRTVDLLGDPLQAAVQSAHRHGLELICCLKPFNGGVAGTYPDGSDTPLGTRLHRRGGRLQHAIPFVQEQPSSRVRRVSAPASGTAPVTTIRLVSKDDQPTRIRAENLEIWTSPKNFAYRKTASCRLKETVEPSPREVRDYFGETITRKGGPVRVLTLDGFSLHDPYVLIATNFQDGEGDFRNTPHAMLQAFDANGDPVPVSVANRSAIWIAPRNFRTYGLEFDQGYGHQIATLDRAAIPAKMNVNDEMNVYGGCIAFARGKNEYLAATPCECDPAVRQLWKNWVDFILHTGADGIDLRISAHGSLTDEPFAYGFNDSIRQAYKGYFRHPLRDSEPDFPGLAQIRGRMYTDFVRETSQKVRAAGKKMHAHVHAEAFRPDPCYGQLMGFPANLMFEWKSWMEEGLLDGITLRTNWFEALDYRRKSGVRRNLEAELDDPVAHEAISLAVHHQIPVTLCRYLQWVPSLDEYVSELSMTYHDARFSGFDLYEQMFLFRASPDGKRLLPFGPAMEKIRREMKSLTSI